MHLKSFEQHRVPYLSVLFLNNKELENKVIQGEKKSKTKEEG